jgi:hypothetical protein
MMIGPSIANLRCSAPGTMNIGVHEFKECFFLIVTHETQMWQLRIPSVQRSEKARQQGIYTPKISYGTLPL